MLLYTRQGCGIANRRASPQSTCPLLSTLSHQRQQSHTHAAWEVESVRTHTDTWRGESPLHYDISSSAAPASVVVANLAMHDSCQFAVILHLAIHHLTIHHIVVTSLHTAHLQPAAAAMAAIAAAAIATSSRHTTVHMAKSSISLYRVCIHAVSRVVQG